MRVLCLRMHVLMVVMLLHMCSDGEPAAQGAGAGAMEPPEGLDEDGMLAWRLMQEEQAEHMRELYMAQGIGACIAGIP